MKCFARTKECQCLSTRFMDAKIQNKKKIPETQKHKTWKKLQDLFCRKKMI